MTINAPAAWLLSLYVALADEQGADRKALQGTTQNDIIKEYLSRGTYVFPPEPSMRLIADMVGWCYRRDAEMESDERLLLPSAGSRARRRSRNWPLRWRPPCAVLDHGESRGQVPREGFPAARVARISFFVNAGVRFVTEMCKMRAFVDLWDEIGRERYGVTDAKARRFRYGVQVNSLGLTEQQPENNVYRILHRDAGRDAVEEGARRAVQLPAWNEALGLPRPWDQQWSLRLQQILAYETDLLEYEDLFDGSHGDRRQGREALKDGRARSWRSIDAMGGAMRGRSTS